MSKSTDNNKEEKVTFWDWLLYGKGTKGEDWPEYTLSSPAVKRECEKVIQAIENSKKRQNGQS